MPTVLVVDDSDANRELVEAYLAGLDCRVVMAADGCAALHAIEQRPPDLVLMDVRMPGIDGYELCQRIRANPRWRLMPVVMIIGFDRSEDRICILPVPRMRDPSVIRCLPQRCGESRPLGAVRA